MRGRICTRAVSSLDVSTTGTHQQTNEANQKSQAIAFGRREDRHSHSPVPSPRLGRITSPHLCNTPSQGSLASLLPNVRKQVIHPAPRKAQKKNRRVHQLADSAGSSRVCFFYLSFFRLYYSSTSVLESTLAGWLAPCLTLCCREAFSSSAAALCGWLGFLLHGKRRGRRAGGGFAPGLRRLVCISWPPSSRTRDYRRQSKGNKRGRWLNFRPFEGVKRAFLTVTKVPLSSCSSSTDTDSPRVRSFVRRIPPPG